MPQLGILRGSVLCLLALPLGMSSPAQSSEHSAQPVAISVGYGSAEFAVRSLDDPANPYRGLYTDFERFVYENAWDSATFLEWRKAVAEADPGRRFVAGSLRPDLLSCSVTPEGWVRPVELSDWQQAEMEEKADWPLLDRALLTPDLRVFGPDKVGRALMTDYYGNEDLFDDYQLLYHKRRAGMTPRIPDWLGTMPPRYTVFVPNGDILTYGPPRQLQPLERQPDGYAWVRPGQNDRGLSWQRYDWDGNLLAEYPTDPENPRLYQSWREIYWPEEEQVLAGPDGLHRRQVMQNGMVWLQIEPVPQVTEQNRAYIDSLGASIPAEMRKSMLEPFDRRMPVAAYAWDGSLLDLNAPLPKELNAWRCLVTDQLVTTYAAQQHWGIWLAD